MQFIQSVKSRIKHSHIFGNLYIHTMKKYYKKLAKKSEINEYQVVFTSFSGRQFSDSPKSIYEWMKNDPKYSNYRLIWAFVDPDKFPEIDSKDKVTIDTPEFFDLLFSSKYWVANTGIERLIPFDHDGHVYIQTWHGVPLKHLGLDESNLEFLVKNWYKNVNFDILTCSSKYDREIFKRIFPSTANIEAIGLPRNYDLVHKNYDYDEIVAKLKLDPKKPILLYAPTFREYQTTKNGSTYLNSPFNENSEKWLAENYNVLMRGHYFTESIEGNPFVDVSDYKDLNELMVVSDMLVTDYSSIMFDYALLNKPILLYMYDFDQYLANRGTYLDPRELGLSYSLNEDDFMKQMKNIDIKNEELKVNIFDKIFNNTNESKSILNNFKY